MVSLHYFFLLRWCFLIHFVSSGIREWDRVRARERERKRRAAHSVCVYIDGMVAKYCVICSSSSCKQNSNRKINRPNNLTQFAHIPCFALPLSSFVLVILPKHSEILVLFVDTGQRRCSYFCRHFFFLSFSILFVLVPEIRMTSL